jgi:hypothetical protein
MPKAVVYSIRSFVNAGNQGFGVVRMSRIPEVTLVIMIYPAYDPVTNLFASAPNVASKSHQGD